MHMTIAELIRILKINKQKRHTLFLGAGSSLSSGMPTVATCIWLFKKEIFLSEHPDLIDQDLDISLKIVQDKIQSYLERKNIIPSPNEDDYSYYFRKCYPVADSRRAFFQKMVDAANPSYGYRIVPLLFQEHFLCSLWTTNFDTLGARACAGENIHTIEIGADCISRFDREIRKDEFLCVSLHGDYRYDLLRNLPEELQTNENKLLEKFSSYISSSSIIVCGYSGRDKCVMSALRKAYVCNNPYSVYWCGYGENDYNEEVKTFIDDVNKHGGKAYYINTQGFDDLFHRLGGSIIESQEIRNKYSIITSSIKDHCAVEKFTLPEQTISHLIKANAIEVSIPTQCWEIKIDSSNFVSWKQCKKISYKQPFAIAPWRGNVYGIGDLSLIKKAFIAEGIVVKAIKTAAISDNEISRKEGAIKSLLLTSLVRMFACNANLETDGRCVLWERTQYTPTDRWGKTLSIYPCFRQVEISLSNMFGKTCITFMPAMRVTDCNGEWNKDIQKAESTKITGWQHNNIFNRDFEYWRKKLFNICSDKIHFPNCPEQSFTVCNKAKALYAGIAQSNQPLPSGQLKDISGYGIKIPEVALLFGSINKMPNISPIEGIVQYGPYSSPVLTALERKGVKLGIVTPSGDDAQKLFRFLGRANESIRTENARDYIADFPGFEKAFKISLDIPQYNSDRCEYISEHLSIKELADEICHAIDRINKRESQDIILIYLPKRWGFPIREENDYEYFDLHDFVKSFCAQKGIVTQFIAEKTTPFNTQSCRVWWWLSLAIYTKAGYTPWVLKAIDNKSAFVGIGYAYANRKESSQIVIGCSHVYNEMGEGLSFRLNQLENPFFDKQKNPYMSKDDARRVGESIIQLFYEQKNKLPQRVVIHKRTPFKSEEIEGLLLGLSKIPTVDLLEINIASQMRFIASEFKFFEQKFNSEYGYPVDRGTILQDGDYGAYLWIHGCVQLPFGKYYQGKRRIPAPIYIKRHYGTTDLSTICEEILGLSKMDFNNMDLYSKMPCTINTAQKIAEIGALLNHVSNRSYDYRLFM